MALVKLQQLSSPEWAPELSSLQEAPPNWKKLNATSSKTLKTIRCDLVPAISHDDLYFTTVYKLPRPYFLKMCV